MALSRRSVLGEGFHCVCGQVLHVFSGGNSVFAGETGL
jgi:hypothetical protein